MQRMLNRDVKDQQDIMKELNNHLSPTNFACLGPIIEIINFNIIIIIIKLKVSLKTDRHFYHTLLFL